MARQLTRSSLTDRCIGRLDDTLRMLGSRSQAPRPNPATSQPDQSLAPNDARVSSGLMRVNHAGEVCAQGLYAGQALLARSPAARTRMLDSAAEEKDHLAWCEARLDELDAKPSALTPVWMLASVGLGAAVALGGDKLSLGFLAATEEQVCEHLDEHIARLPKEDQRSAAILKQMRTEEAAHKDAAHAAGGLRFSAPVQGLMRLTSQLMVRISYYI